MCGFAAFFEYEKEFDKSFLEQAGDDIFHRGPDSGGFYQEKGCGLVFRRLAIIDPNAKSDQPMHSVNNRYVITFNGEIYNYKEIRKELEQAGINLKTSGDTEAIIEGYSLWGEEIVNKLEGMFAFVIWDKEEKKAFVARDVYGIKPLYMCRFGNMVAFASEARVLRRIVGTEIDTDALSELILFRYASGKLSNYKNIELLEGGKSISLSLNPLNLSEKRYCDILDSFKNPINVNEQEALELIEQAVVKSVKDHLQSDVGYGVQLSGGVDSSLVTALASQFTQGKLKTYGVNLLPHSDDESEYRDMVIKQYNIEHHEISMNGIDFADALPRAVTAMEGPSPHFGCVMLMLLCEEIRKTQKVVLTGEGADELFGGYYRYQAWKRFDKYGKIAPLIPSFLWDSLLKRYVYIKEFSKHDPAIVTCLNYSIWQTAELFPDLIPHKTGQREKVSNKFKDFRDRMSAVDQTSYLQSHLMRQDKLAMATAVETRVPFTHYPLAKVVNRLPRDLRIPGGVTKPLLKKLAEKWLPHDLLYRRKVGLTLPLDKWLEDEKALGRYLDDLISPDSKIMQYGDKARIKLAINNFRAGKKDIKPMLLAHLVNLECWLRSLDNPSKLERSSFN